jgi:hypothetical protein
VNTKSPSERDREILSSVKKEMEMPRLTSSVREGQIAEAALAAEERAAHAAQA